jgi:hypothetical protein
MKKIQDLLKRKRTQAVLDEKTLARVFLEAAKEEIKNFKSEDIREIKLKSPPASSREASRAGKILYIKTAHPVVSSELFLWREKIVEKINEIAGAEEIERIIIG